MTIKNIDMNMKWNDYPSDVLYLWNGEDLFKILEGSGCNLLEGDIEEGYADYWMTECNADGGGQWMETQLISEIDYTIQGVIDRMSECDLWDDDWEVLDEDLGSELEIAMDNSNIAQARLNYLLRKIKEDR